MADKIVCNTETQQVNRYPFNLDKKFLPCISQMYLTKDKKRHHTDTVHYYKYRKHNIQSEAHEGLEIVQRKN